MISIRSTEQLLERPLDVSCIIITYPISSNFCKKRFSGTLLALQFSIFLVYSFMALQFSIFLVTSFIKDFLFISFQQENEIKKGNTLMEFKYLLSCSRIDLFDVKDFKRNSTDGTWSEDVFKENLMLQFSWLKEFR